MILEIILIAALSHVILYFLPLPKKYPISFLLRELSRGKEFHEDFKRKTSSTIDVEKSLARVIRINKFYLGVSTVMAFLIIKLI